ncbi:hypothetical protein PR202_ga02542 [Eleusine coracana subsp. coracana]|uniref:Uncharacterized protein n=1 Tax=Eleusine coracana subsp. coracana TaxID=191504 RepID=A0AAV5BL78_ELECO|nr:hypothetical protein PR202_ga02542 [Eleusine coracana subsp. coracana]
MEAVLARAFALGGKVCQRPLNRYFHVPASPGRLSYMQQQLRRLHQRLAQQNPRDEQHQEQNNRRGVPDILEQNWSMRHNNTAMENSDDPAVDPIRATFDWRFYNRFATLRSIEEDRIREHKLELLLKRKPAPICYVWCDPFPSMPISQVLKQFFLLVVEFLFAAF